MIGLPEGRITAIEPQKGHARRYSIFVDGEFALGVEEEVIVRLGLRVGMIWQAGDLDELTSEEEVARARTAALRLLERRSRSRVYLDRHLSTKGYSEAVVRRALDRLTETGLVDDRQLARDLVEMMLGGQWGRRAMVARLRREGIGRELAEEVLAELAAAESERERAERALIKLAPKLEGLPAVQRRNKIYQFLYRRGFSADVIAELLAALADD